MRLSDPLRNADPISSGLTSNFIDIPDSHPLAFDRNAPEKFTMANAPTKAQHYGPAMRDVRGHQRSRTGHKLYALDPMRRLADTLMACVLLAIASALMLFVAVAIKFESPGPIFEKQDCIGRGSRRFQMLKFRTVVHDPEGTRPVWARQPTRIGEFLRYTRIDALPQLINVLHGEMSLIDPAGGSPSFLD
jgi:lipopolysaccharide/colanic/teichoic acid biosynthesis glycosyltransferase